MKNLIISSCEQKRSLSIKVFAAACLLALVSCCLTSNILAQPTITHIMTCHTCGGVSECCYDITITVPSGESLAKAGFGFEGTVPDMGGNYPSDCWDFDCAISSAAISGGSGSTTINGAKLRDVGTTGWEEVGFTFSGGGNDSLVGPATLEFFVCGKASCAGSHYNPIDVGLTWVDNMGTRHTPAEDQIALTGCGGCKIGATGSSAAAMPTSNEGLSNYPNPLSAVNAFKTTIPFEIANEGTAKITLFDETGRVAFTDAQDFTGAGKHFFYFTGSQLPAGKYFYSIESPIGMQIVRKNLLIVK